MGKLNRSAAMAIAFATGHVAVAIVAALVGIMTEYRRMRAEGSVAIAGTMQWSSAAAIFSLLGLRTGCHAFAANPGYHPTRWANGPGKHAAEGMLSR